MDSYLTTNPSAYPVRETADRFEGAVKAKGWMVFGEVDHAAAAAQYGLELRARTVILFGNPKGGTPLMQAAPTLAIDLPMKALVWEDDRGKVWLTYNSADFTGTALYPRHGLSVDPPNVAGAQILAEFARQATG